MVYLLFLDTKNRTIFTSYPKFRHLSRFLFTLVTTPKRSVYNIWHYEIHASVGNKPETFKLTFKYVNNFSTKTATVK